jgi:hypothetical protein
MSKIENINQNQVMLSKIDFIEREKIGENGNKFFL